MGLPNAMWSFRGKPTIFGAPRCTDEGRCFNDVIMQYQPESDTWRELGGMAKARTMHQVI